MSSVFKERVSRAILELHFKLKVLLPVRKFLRSYFGTVHRGTRILIKTLMYFVTNEHFTFDIVNATKAKSADYSL